MTTRDSKAWWFLIAGAVITAVSSRMDLLDPLMPAQHTDKAHAIIELLALIVGIVSAKLATSPLPISDQGRQDYRDKADTVRLDRR